jgi:UDP-N-acetylmuramate--alanine ligase
VELEACIVSARELFPGKKLTGIFQPHLYSRTRDLCDGFASSLSLLDQVILLDIYPAREQPIPGVDAALIFDKITVKNKQLLSKENLIENLSIGEGEVLMTLGAGDIDTMVIPIREKLMARDMEGV